jgi:hypothetical protein
MTYRLRLLPQVEQDVLAGYEWYDQKTQGLGDEFLHMFYSCISGALRNPLLRPKV